MRKVITVVILVCVSWVWWAAAGVNLAEGNWSAMRESLILAMLFALASEQVK